MAYQETRLEPRRRVAQRGAAAYNSRNRWVFPIAFLVSALFHAAVLVLPGGLRNSSPSHPGGDDAVASTDMISALKLIQLAPTPAASIPTAVPELEDEPISGPGPDVHSAPSSITPKTRNAPSPTVDPVRFLNTDARLWTHFDATDADVREQRRLPTQLHINALIDDENHAGLRLWGLTIPIPSCDTFLTCELGFQRISELDDAFGRYLEIEQQAALTALYRQRLEAMRVRHGNRR